TGCFPGLHRLADAKTHRPPDPPEQRHMNVLDYQAAWQAVIHHPLFGLGITLVVYQLAVAGYERTRSVLFQPVLFSMVVVIGVLLASGLAYDDYRDSVLPLTLLLGPATV